MIDKVDHICVAVKSIEQAVRLFIGVLGAEFIGGGDNPRLGVRAVQLRLPPGVKFELLQPLDPDGFLAKFIERNGEGFHHLTAYTPDVMELERELNAHGFETVDTNTAHPNWLETFTRPSTTFGALLQFSTPSHPWTDPIPGITLDDVLAGKVEVLDNNLTWKESREVIWPPDDGAVDRP
jgi:methylmalonyl-CoA/ethylmalonyl-CoA epimerase